MGTTRERTLPAIPTVAEFEAAALKQPEPEPEPEPPPEPVKSAEKAIVIRRGPKKGLAANRRAQMDGTLESLGRSVVGGKQKVMEMLVRAQTLYPKLAPMAEEWAAMSVGARGKSNLDELAQAKGIQPYEVFEALAGFAMRTNRDVGVFLVAMKYPDVVRKTTDVAMTTRGFKDREWIHRAMGTIPEEKTAPVQILNQVAASAQVNVQEEKLDPMEKVLRSFAEPHVFEESNRSNS